MASPIVLITFRCQTGDTEKQALNIAVGAVQARAAIRLRRIPDGDSSGEGEALARMRKEYVAPAEADLIAADAIVLVDADETTSASEAWKGFLELLSRLHSEGRLTSKCVAGLGRIEQTLGSLGIKAATGSSGDALAFGRSVAEAAKTLKQHQEAR